MTFHFNFYIFAFSLFTICLVIDLFKIIQYLPVFRKLLYRGTTNVQNHVFSFPCY